jgi:hypothetical protein
VCENNLRAIIIIGARMLNAEMEEKEKERDERWAANLQPAWTQKPRHFVRGTCEPYFNDEELNYYTSWLRGRL